MISKQDGNIITTLVLLMMIVDPPGAAQIALAAI
jgi:hypothetical protein